MQIRYQPPSRNQANSYTTALTTLTGLYRACFAVRFYNSPIVLLRCSERRLPNAASGFQRGLSRPSSRGAAAHRHPRPYHTTAITHCAGGPARVLAGMHVRADA
jgi:hypothetical protein